VNTTAIYGLYDPRQPRMVMYVGKGLAKRAAHHWPEFVKHGTAENKLELAWFEQLRAAGVEPVWHFLETNVPVRRWHSREKAWSAYWRERNPNLCNVSKGGNAFPEECAAIGGRIAKEKGLGFFAPKWRGVGGRIGGRSNVINKTGFCAPGVATKAGRIGGRIGGRISGRIVGLRRAHKKCHVARRVFNPKCSLCVTARANNEPWQRNAKMHSGICAPTDGTTCTNKTWGHRELCRSCTMYMRASGSRCRAKQRKQAAV
jgi:hypothetical protein